MECRFGIVRTCANLRSTTIFELIEEAENGSCLSTYLQYLQYIKVGRIQQQSSESSGTCTTTSKLIIFKYIFTMDMDNIDVDDFFNNLDLESIFEEGAAWDDLDLTSSSSADHVGSTSSSPELTGVGTSRNADAGGVPLRSTQPLLSAAPQPTGVVNGPQLVSVSTGTSIYRSQDTGIKVINQSTSTPSNVPQTIQKLLHEETVSKRLRNQCNNHRQVREVGSFNGSPALYFKWENGITCKEWLDKVQQIHPHVVGFNVRLRAAMAIAQTLSQFHQCSVAYNSLSSENIVLTPLEGDYVAKFIDLSEAVICNDEQTFKEMMASDLISLGLIFDQLFKEYGEGGEAAGGDYDVGGGSTRSGRRVSMNSEVEDGEDFAHNRNVRKRGKQRTPGEGLPLYLGAMISTLLVSGDDNDSSQLRYKSVNDVYEDLKAMAAEDVSLHRSTSLRDECDNEGFCLGRLKFPKDLFYGRQVQMSMILHLLQSSTMLGDQPLMALIAGYPGTG